MTILPMMHPPCHEILARAVMEHFYKCISDLSETESQIKRKERLRALHKDIWILCRESLKAAQDQIDGLMKLASDLANCATRPPIIMERPK